MGTHQTINGDPVQVWGSPSLSPLNREVTLSGWTRFPRS